MSRDIRKAVVLQSLSWVTIHALGKTFFRAFQRARFSERG